MSADDIRMEQVEVNPGKCGYELEKRVNVSHNKKGYICMNERESDWNREYTRSKGGKGT